MGSLRDWLTPARPTIPVTDRRARRALIIELVLVFSITLGLAAIRSLLSLLDALLAPESLAEQSVAINSSVRQIDLLDLFHQLTGMLQLIAWGGLGCYLLWRGGTTLAAVGLGRLKPGRDAAAGAGLAALIGVPGLGLYFLARALGANLTVLPAALDDTWWRVPVLVLSAIGNSWAEEVLVVGYLLTRLRQLGLTENGSLLLSAILRGSYHLYQGFGGFVGNLVMGLIYGRFWQRTNRLWPLVVAHALIDIVAFAGYALLRPYLSWLP